MEHSVKDFAKQAPALIKASDLYLDTATSFYEETYWEALKLTVSRSRRKSGDETALRRAGFIWFVLYDIISAHGRELIKNDVIVSTILYVLEQHEHVGMNFLEDTLNSISKQETAYNSYFDIYYRIDKDGEVIDESKENHDVTNGLEFISNKFLQDSLLGQLLAHDFSKK